jgi:hypothetical protein
MEAVGVFSGGLLRRAYLRGWSLVYLDTGDELGFCSYISLTNTTNTTIYNERERDYSESHLVLK